MGSLSRRIVMASALISVAGFSAGCNMNSDIPVVQFPEGSKPNPPAPVPKADPKAKGVGTMSKGDPSTDYR